MNLEDILKIVVAKSASDLFITVGAAPSIKVNGEICPLDQEKLTPEASRDMVLGSMSDKQIAEFEQTHECNYALSQPGIGRFRVSAFIQRNTPGMVLRRIETVIPSLEELKLPPILQNISLTKRGLVIIVGATGSGKSSSMAAMIDHRNRSSSGHIITIEDPIEFVHQSKKCLINQREVHRDTLGFSEALRSALREDPDIILVGEMRDLETISLALTAAETGHLVLSTLHTSSAVKAVDRIIDIFPSSQKGQIRSMLSESLEAVIAQKLIPTKDGKGRVPACEVMITTTAIRNLIREDRIFQIDSVMQSGGVEGMQTLDQDLQRLVSQGNIDRSTAAQIANNPKLFGANVL